MRDMSPKMLSLQSLQDDEQETCQLALAQRARAYAPYSGFCVGAAVRTTTGRTYLGCNVENASYGLTICAERNAVAAAISAGDREFVHIAIATDNRPPASPCGACRQVLYELGPTMTVLLVNPQDQVERSTLSDLLPRGFDGTDLKRDV